MAITTGTTASHPCLKLQEDISKFYALTPATESASTGTLDALYSPGNKSGVMQLVQGDGMARPTSTSNRKIQVRYVPTTCETSGPTWDECTSTTPQAPLWKTADITVNRNVTFGFDVDEYDYKDMCETTDAAYVAFINAKYIDAKKRLNDLAIVDMVGLMGNYPVSGNNSVTTPVTVPVSTPTGAFNPAGFGLIQTTYNQMNVSGTPIIIGAGKLDYAKNAMLYSGVANTGLDGSKGVFSYFRDPQINSGFWNNGEDHIHSFASGVIQVAEWYEYTGMSEKTFMFNINGRTAVEKALTTIVMPDGLRWDLRISYNCGTWEYRFSKWIGVYGLPSDSFGDCQDYNYALHFLAGCADLTCNDINSLVGPGAQSS